MGYTSNIVDQYFCLVYQTQLLRKDQMDKRKELHKLSNCEYELKNLPRLILGPIHPNQVIGTDPVGSYHGTRNSRSNSINPTYPFQSHDLKRHHSTHMCAQSKTINQGLDSDPGGNRLGSARPSPH